MPVGFAAIRFVWMGDSLAMMSVNRYLLWTRACHGSQDGFMSLSTQAAVQETGHLQFFCGLFLTYSSIDWGFLSLNPSPRDVRGSGAGEGPPYLFSSFYGK